MGAAPSQSASFGNAEPSGVIIQITEEVALRMASRRGKQKQSEAQEARESVPTKVAGPRPVAGQVEKAPHVSDVVNPSPSATASMTVPPKAPTPPVSGLASMAVPPSSVSEVAPTTVPSTVTPMTVPPSDLTTGAIGLPILETVTAYEVRQQKEQELRENDEFWGSKLRELEEKYVASALIAHAEIKQKVEKLDKSVLKPKCQCQDVSAKVAQCYSENGKQPLRCSDVVKEFAMCFENHAVAN